MFQQPLIVTRGLASLVKVLCRAVLSVGCSASVDESGRSHLRLSHDFFFMQTVVSMMCARRSRLAANIITLQHFFVETRREVFVFLL